MYTNRLTQKKLPTTHHHQGMPRRFSQPFRPQGLPANRPRFNRSKLLPLHPQTDSKNAKNLQSLLNKNVLTYSWLQEDGEREHYIININELTHQNRTSKRSDNVRIHYVYSRKDNAAESFCYEVSRIRPLRKDDFLTLVDMIGLNELKQQCTDATKKKL